MPRTELGAARLIQHRRQAPGRTRACSSDPYPLPLFSCSAVSERSWWWYWYCSRSSRKEGERLDQVRCGCGVGQGRPPLLPASPATQHAQQARGQGMLSGKYIRALLGVQQNRDEMKRDERWRWTTRSTICKAHRNNVHVQSQSHHRHCNRPSTSREQRVKAPSSPSGGGLVLFEDRRGVGSCRTIL